MSYTTLSADKVSALPVKASVSYLFNNLSFSGTQFAFVHQNEAHITLDTTTVKKGATHLKIVAKENSPVTQVKWVNTQKNGSNPNKNNLVITTQSHFQVYDSDCSKAIFTYALPAPAANEAGKPKYTRGIATALIQNKTFLLIGTSKGLILVFEFLQAKSKECCTLTQTLNNHAFPICDIESDSISPIWASEMEASLYGTNFNQLRLSLERDSLICGLGNGIVSVHETAKGTKVADICAHSRFIQAIDLHPDLNVFATVSEDATLKLWQVSDANNTYTASHLQTIPVKDSLLCGVQFCGEGAENIAVAAYDAVQIVVFTR